MTFWHLGPVMRDEAVFQNKDAVSEVENAVVGGVGEAPEGGVVANNNGVV